MSVLPTDGVTVAPDGLDRRLRVFAVSGVASDGCDQRTEIRVPSPFEAAAYTGGDGYFVYAYVATVAQDVESLVVRSYSIGDEVRGSWTAHVAVVRRPATMIVDPVDIVIVGHVAFVRAWNDVIAIQLSTGAILWQSDVLEALDELAQPLKGMSDVEKHVAMYGEDYPSVRIDADDSAVVVAGARWCVALSASSGRALWALQHGSQDPVVGPLIVDGVVFVSMGAVE